MEASAARLPGGRRQWVVRDIEPRKRIESELRESRERLGLALRGSALGSWDWNIISGEVVFDRRWFEMRGYRPEEVRPHVDSWISGIHPEDWPHVQQTLDDYFQGRLPEYETEFRVKTKSDEWIWVLDRGKLFARDEHGRPARMLGTELDITQRKRMEAELLVAKAKSDGVLAISADAIISIDAEQRITLFNDGAEEIFGYSRAETIGAPLSMLVPEGLRAVHRQHVETFAAGHEVARPVGGRGVAIYGRRKSGEVFPADAAISKLEVGGERILTVALRDITAQKRIENALRLAEARSTGILTIAADAIISVDGSQRITLFNDGAEQIFGYTKAEVIGAPLEILIPERLRAMHHQHVENVATGDAGARRMGEQGRAIVGLRKNGQEFPADAAFSKIEVGGERVLTVVLRDVTARWQSERQERFLADLGSVLASTLDDEETARNVASLAARDLAEVCIIETVEGEEQIPRCLKVVHRDPDKAAITATLEQVLTLRGHPHLGSAVLATKRPLVMGEVTAAFLESLSQGEEHRRALGALAPKSFMALPLLTHGRLVGAMTLIRTVEAEPYSQGEINLAEEVAARAALAVENARLYRISQRAIQARDDVLGIVAHDLRNPLNSIVMQASLLRRRAMEPEHRTLERADAIERAARRMNRLIQDLLDVTRMDAGGLALEQDRLPTGLVLTDALEAQKHLAASASLELRLDVSQPLPDVWADRDRLLQVFENLVGNAMKFTEPGGVITVGAAPRDGEVLFWVADTGTGIPTADMPRLFDRFWQARKTGRSGAGLGLPIVKGIIEAHGGRIWVESAQGRGSTFFFTIPTGARTEGWRSGLQAQPL